MSTSMIDAAKAEAFAERLLGTLNAGAIAIMTSVGHRTGLFDTLATLPPATSTQIAQAAGLNERYVREWLAAMTTGRIVAYEPTDQTYALPPEHAAFLTRAATPNNLAVSAQFISLVGGVEDGIVAAFRNGGGLHYEQYGRFHDVMAEDSAQTIVSALLDTILPLVPGLIAMLHRGIDVLDLGCGQGRALILLAQTFPTSRFTGYDAAADVIATAQTEIKQRGLKNIAFTTQDAARLDEPNRYDLICTFDAIHDQAYPRQVLRNIGRALRPGGMYLMQDIRASSQVHHNMDHPVAPFLYTISTMHCMSVSLAAGGDGLGTMWGEELALAMLAEAGFTDIAVKQLPHDFMNNYYIARKV